MFLNFLEHLSLLTKKSREVERIYTNLYKTGVDSYDVDEAKTSSSKGAAWVKKGFLNANDTYNKYVAYVNEAA